MWSIGKIHERLDNTVVAYSWFKGACVLKPDSSEPAREACHCAMKLGRTKVAVTYADYAARIDPENDGLQANLAVAKLCNQEPQDAKIHIRKALLMCPDDTVSKQLLSIIDRVLGGKLPCPSSYEGLLRLAKQTKS